MVRMFSISASWYDSVHHLKADVARIAHLIDKEYYDTAAEHLIARAEWPVRTIMLAGDVLGKAAGVASFRTPYVSRTQSALSGALSGAATGGMIGSSFGPQGALIGAGIGAVVGAAGGLVD